MPPNRFRTGYVASADDGAGLEFAKAENRHFTVRYTPAPNAVEIATGIDEEFNAPTTPILLLEGDAKSDIVVIHPLNTTATNRRFLQPKYGALATISLHGFDVPDASDLDEVHEFLRNLPSGFVKDPFFGLGLNYDLRYLADAFEEIEGVSDLRVVRGRSTGLPKIDGKSYVISTTMLD